MFSFQVRRSTAKGSTSWSGVTIKEIVKVSPIWGVSIDGMMIIDVTADATGDMITADKTNIKMLYLMILGILS